MDHKSHHKVNCSILSQQTCLNNARALLYESYVKHLSWDIRENNPSNIKITHREEHITLTDDYDDISIWFSLSNEENVIACARLCHDDQNGLFEIERYKNARQVLKPILDQKERLNLIELNREAILPSFSEHKELYGLLLLKDVFEYCLSRKFTILTTCNIPDWVYIYELISFMPIDNCSFKYDDSETKPVSVYLATPEDIEQLLNNINITLSRLSHNMMTTM